MTTALLLWTDPAPARERRARVRCVDGPHRASMGLGGCMHLTPGTVVERWVVEAELGRGGMAVVYRVRHRELRTSHALKVLLIPVGAVRERLMREGRVQAALQHPNIVNVTDVLEVEGAPGLVMQFVDGSSLDHFLARRRLTLAQADALARGILRGVAFAHRRGVVHRDLKPANILLQRTDDTIVPKVADFGLVKVLDDGSGTDPSGTRSGVFMGTPRYMAPEQMRDSSKVDARADVFALGAMLYEMVCGEPAFGGDDVVEVLHNAARGQHGPLRERVPDLPEAFEAAILGALEVDRDTRIPDAGTLLEVWSAQRRWAGRGTEAEGTATPWDTSVEVGGAPVEDPSHLDGTTYLPFQYSHEAPSVAPSVEPVEPVEHVEPVEPSVAPPAEPARRWWWWVGAPVAAVLIGAAAALSGWLGGPGASDVAETPLAPRPAPVAAPEPAPQPEPEPVAPVPASAAPAPTAPAPAVAAPAPVASVAGTWSGTANERPFELVLHGSGGELTGEVTFVLGELRNTKEVRGAHDPSTGRVTLTDVEGAFEYQGTLADGVLAGTYGRAGAATRLPFRVVRQ